MQDSKYEEIKGILEILGTCGKPQGRTPLPPHKFPNIMLFKDKLRGEFGSSPILTAILVLVPTRAAFEMLRFMHGE